MNMFDEKSIGVSACCLYLGMAAGAEQACPDRVTVLEEGGHRCMPEQVRAGSGCRY